MLKLFERFFYKRNEQFNEQKENQLEDKCSPDISLSPYPVYNYAYIASYSWKIIRLQLSYNQTVEEGKNIKKK